MVEIDWTFFFKILLVQLLFLLRFSTTEASISRLLKMDMTLVVTMWLAMQHEGSVGNVMI